MDQTQNLLQALKALGQAPGSSQEALCRNAGLWNAGGSVHPQPWHPKRALCPCPAPQTPAVPQGCAHGLSFAPYGASPHGRAAACSLFKGTPGSGPPGAGNAEDSHQQMSAPARGCGSAASARCAPTESLPGWTRGCRSHGINGNPAGIWGAGHGHSTARRGGIEGKLRQGT